MAGNIKGITIEFQGDTTSLDRALRSIDKETSGIDSELRKVNKGLKFNPTSVELWRQKQTLLAQKVKETSDRLTVLKNAQKQMDANGVDKNSKEYRELQREIIATESKLKTFTGQLKAVGNVKLRAASEQLKQMGSRLTAAGQATAGLSRAGAALAAGIGALAVKSGRYADDLNTLSKQYRINTRELQKYKAAADLVDVGVEDIAKSHVKLTKNMGAAQRGSKTQSEAFKKLGIQITNADGTLRDSDTVWQETIKALGKMSNETERDSIAMELMGKSAANLNPLIADGGETYEKLSKTLKKYDLDFIDQDTLDRANEFNDKLDVMKAIGGIAFQNLGMKLADVLAPALQKVVGWISQLAKWIGNLNPVVVAAAGGIGALVAVISPLLLFAGALVSAMGALTGALAAVSAPAIAVGAAIAALVAAFATAYAKSEPFRTVVNDIAKIIGASLLTVLKAAVSFFKQLVAVIADTVTGVATELAPVLKALMPVIKWLATFLAGRLKASFTYIINVVKLLGTVLKTLASMARTVFTALGTLATGAYNKIKGAFSKVKNALTNPFETAKNTIKGIVDKIKGFFPLKFGKIFEGLKLPHFTVDGGKFPFGVAGKGKAPKWDVSWYAKGGIFDSPTIAGIGESGAEAVIPLDKFWRKLEGMQFSGATINVYPSAGMSEKTLAEEVAKQLTKLQNRRRQAWQ